MNTRRDEPDNESTFDLEEATSVVRERLHSRYPDCPSDLIEDAVGDATAQWIERYHDLGGDLSRVRMLTRLAEWRLLDRLSSRKRDVPVPSETFERLDDSRANVEKLVMEREAGRFARSMYLLTARSKRVLSLWSKGYTFREISLRLHLKMVTVRKKKERALKKLRDRLSRTRAPDPAERD